MFFSFLSWKSLSVPKDQPHSFLNLNVRIFWTSNTFTWIKTGKIQRNPDHSFLHKPSFKLVRKTSLPRPPSAPVPPPSCSGPSETGSRAERTCGCPGGQGPEYSYSPCSQVSLETILPCPGTLAPPPLYLPNKAGSSRAGLQASQSVEEELEALVGIKFAPRRLRIQQNVSEKTRRAQSFITWANCLACAPACTRTGAGDRASWPGSGPSCLCSVPSSLGLSVPICNPRDWRVCLQSLPSFLRLLSQAVLLL